MLKNLKKLRNQKNISQKQLAEIVGVSQQSINKYENHKVEPDINTLIRLANYFSTSVDYIIGNAEEQEMKESVISNDELLLLSGYRLLNESQKESIRMVIKNYNSDSTDNNK